MPSMIETLINAGLKRPDKKRLVPSRRPMPSRPRDLLEVIITLGQQATVPTIVKSCDLRSADARHLTYVVLGRWPTTEELAAQPEEYSVLTHLRTLLHGREFRANLIRRICDNYPERPRLLYVRIPRCAGEHFTDMANTMHAIFPAGLQSGQPGEQQQFVPALGAYLGRFNLTRTIQIIQPRLAPFIRPATRPQASDELNWWLDPPPRRPGDRLFTILREPRSLVLSQVNAILTALRAPAPAHSDTPGTQARDVAAWRTRLGPLPPEANAAAWTALGVKILHALPLRDPICQALGEGTAASALQAARLCDLEIADLSLYADWVKYTWDVEPDPPSNTSTPILVQQDLAASDADHLDRMVAEDLLFYDRVKAALATLGELKMAVRGRDL